jgi:hypothetical protein
MSDPLGKFFMKKNVWHPVTDHPELLVGQYIVPNFVSNSVAIKLSESEFLLISPGEPLLQSFIDAYGSQVKLHIIYPNAYHHMGVSAWLEAFDNVTLYASDKAANLLNEKEVTELVINPLEYSSPPLPSDYSVLFPPGHKAGDVWLRKQNSSVSEANKSSTWITCDSFLNYDRLSNQPIARFMQRLLSAAPGLKMSQVVKWFIMDDRKGFKAWVTAQLSCDNPTTLIPSHGEVRQGSGLSNEILDVVNLRL